ncbi:MAG TPA: hypothetical protein VKY86_03735 [Promicromonospora sp.]|nr:hypothetical protein [Promicromonospora sp.]
MKKLLAGGTLAVLTFGGVLAGAATASAHTPRVAADCGWLEVNLQAYRGAKVTVTIDGAVAHEEEFQSGFSKKFEGLAQDVTHDWTVTVDAYDGYDGTQYDWEDSGQIDPCVEPAPEPSPSVPAEPEPTEPPAAEPEPSDEPSVVPSEEAPVPPAEPSESPSPVAEEPPVLAATGATVGGAVAFAALLAAGGVALVWARKRMQQSA